MSELLQKQFLFTEHLALLIQHAHLLGYKIKLGEVLRSNEQAEINAMGFDGRKALVSLIRNSFPLLASKIEDNRGNGIRNSVHMFALAADVQLFDQAGKWLQEKYPYELLADFWENFGPEHKAGVRFGDTPHYSIMWNGAK
jgi:hypothetical protein